MTPEIVAKMITAHMRAYEASQREQAETARRGLIAAGLGYRDACNASGMVDLYVAAAAAEAAAIAAAKE